MANIERAVAKQLLLAHREDWGSSGSIPKLQTLLFSETIQARLEDEGIAIDPYTLAAILRDLAGQDYIAIAPDPGSAPDGLKVLKVFPARLKRDFNLWDVLEEG